ncbi:MAG: NUDIX domain-containing protein [Myxococcales bacterium]
MAERRALSVSVFARHGGRVLLIRHRRLGTWLPVGGEVHDGETPLEAARRELREETGLEGSFELVSGVDGTPAGFLGYEEHPAGSKGLHMNLSFVAEVSSEAVRPNGGFDEWRWVEDPAEVDCPRNVVELGRMALRAGGAPAIARAWLAAFNARDLEALCGLYGPDGAHASPDLRAMEPQGEARGKEALRAYWSALLGRSEGMRLDERRLIVDGSAAILECERVAPGLPALPVALSLIIEGGLVHASRLYLG